ncbi:hypothetical protein Scep_023920 [Stephania cephalantha]|uniref:Uncharacterized protein n=1 Tax=Stephania cephalantha TaxID=152367 RepID=A0AAP0EYC4_9MAGN
MASHGWQSDTIAGRLISISLHVADADWRGRHAGAASCWRDDMWQALKEENSQISCEQMGDILAKISRTSKAS